MMDQSFSSSSALYNEHEYENLNFGTAVDNRWHQFQNQQENLPKPQPELQPGFGMYPPEMYQNRVALGPAPNVDYGMAPMFGAGGAQYGQQQYGQPYLQNMMRPASLAPLPNTYVPQSGMVMGPNPPQHYGGYAPGPQAMGVMPSYSPPVQTTFAPVMTANSGVAGSLPQVRAAASAFDVPVVQAQLPGPSEAVNNYLASHTLEELQALMMQQHPGHNQHFDQRLMPQLPSEGATEGGSVRRTTKGKGKGKAVNGNGAARKTTPRQRCIPPEDDPEFEQKLDDGVIKYKCLRRHCTEDLLKRSSVREHKKSNIHNQRNNHLLCLACGSYFSRSDGLSRHAKSKQCARNQEKKMFASTSAAPLPVTEPQWRSTFKGKTRETQASPPSVVNGPNFASGSGAQPIVQTPRLNSVTNNASSFPVFAQDTISLTDALFNVQAPHIPHSTPHYSSDVPPMPVTAQDFSIFEEGEEDTDLFGSPAMDTAQDFSIFEDSEEKEDVDLFGSPVMDTAQNLSLFEDSEEEDVELFGSPVMDTAALPL
ncbi:hypothetical protein DEU56DRAFT_978182 [Suillus clintonianus]|uniref:uncharacterized protein n=1 Tax=Suillus clintonianus TaxID=1904413 RepID=UPI001B877CB4|nr:uncharacterized protein DEU56DRAFT_978182 [Suillus clintonianus]KAG2148955.1 hypothetical protein DEU56DRAFT_978182 [Suillus clintonianus]